MTPPAPPLPHDRTLPFFKFYPAAWRDDEAVLAMTWAEQGVYLALLCIAWRADDPCTIPADGAAIARLLRMAPDEWAQYEPAIFGVFPRVEGTDRRRNPKLYRVHLETAEYRAGQAARATARWAKVHGLAPSPAAPVAAPKAPMAPKAPPKPKAPPRDDPPGFAAFWQAYPSRPGSSRVDAVTQYRLRVAEGTSPDDLARAARAYTAQLTADGKLGTPYVMHAATFLGPSGRWSSFLEATPLAEAAERWDFYKRHGMLAKGEGPEYWTPRLVDGAAERGVSVDQLRAEIKHTKPWDIAARWSTAPERVTALAGRLATPPAAAAAVAA